MEVPVSVLRKELLADRECWCDDASDNYIKVCERWNHDRARQCKSGSEFNTCSNGRRTKLHWRAVEKPRGAVGNTHPLTENQLSLPCNGGWFNGGGGGDVSTVNLYLKSCHLRCLHPDIRTATYKSQQINANWQRQPSEEEAIAVQWALTIWDDVRKYYLVLHFTHMVCYKIHKLLW